MSQERRILRIDVTDPAEPKLIGFETSAPVSVRKRHPRPGEHWYHPGHEAWYQIGDVLPANEWHDGLVIVNIPAGYLALTFPHFLAVYTLEADPS